MTNSCGNQCGNNGCNMCMQTNSSSSGSGMSSFAFILVLFILLVICGAAYIF